MAEGMLSLGYELAVGLPGTGAAFRSGVLSQRKAVVIAAATACWTRPRPGRPRRGCWTGPGR